MRANILANNIHSIAQYLPVPECLVLVRVCKRWREAFIRDCSGMVLGRLLEVGDEETGVCGEKAWEILRDIYSKEPTYLPLDTFEIIPRTTYCAATQLSTANFIIPSDHSILATSLGFMARSTPSLD